MGFWIGFLHSRKIFICTPEYASVITDSAQLVENLPAVQETQVQSLDGEDPLEKEMATHSSILDWEISRTKEPGSLQSMESQKYPMQLT